MSSSGVDWSAVGEGKRATITPTPTLVVLSLRQIAMFPRHLHQLSIFSWSNSSSCVLSLSIIWQLSHHLLANDLFNNHLVTSVNLKYSQNCLDVRL